MVATNILIDMDGQQHRLRERIRCIANATNAVYARRNNRVWMVNERVWMVNERRSGLIKRIDIIGVHSIG
jgi:hypothetical protein